MKVVLFCGGLGMRLREYSESIPKPMVHVGYRPLLWHVMRYYAHFGYKDFILCLGYRADIIKEYFLKYEETVSNDFVLSEGGRRIDLLRSDIHDWKITFVDTGLNSNIGQRLKAVEKHLEGEEMFLANYSDGLSDVPLPDIVNYARKTGAVATFLGVRPTQSFHVVRVGDAGEVAAVARIEDTGLLINGGFFVLRKEIFNYLKEGEELVNEPFQRLIGEKKLSAYPYNGFWACMDTFKDKQLLDDLYAKGQVPWEVWKVGE